MGGVSLPGELYRFEHSIEKVEPRDRALFRSGGFAQVDLTLEDLARMVERGSMILPPGSRG